VKTTNNKSQPQIFKGKYINNHWMETQLSIQLQSDCLSLVELSSFQLVHISKGKFIGNPNEKEISRVALLSPVLFFLFFYFYEKGYIIIDTEKGHIVS
jgi:hypothetical protein